jgi:hypothetical protein
MERYRQQHELGCEDLKWPLHLRSCLHQEEEVVVGLEVGLEVGEVGEVGHNFDRR